MNSINKLLDENNISYSTNFNLKNCRFSKLVTLQDSCPTGIAFIDHLRKDKSELLESAKAKYIICDSTLVNPKKNLIYVENPKLIFSILGNILLEKNIEYRIDQSAIVHPEAEIDFPVYIGPNVTIGRAKIGKGSIINSNSVIHDNVVIGQNVIIFSGAVLGAIGFGYNRDRLGHPIQFPHVGNVIIEDFVEVGANSCIDLGALSETRVGYMSKIDNLVHIGHNVQIGEGVLIAARASIAGSCVIGDFTNVWTGVSIANNLTIGNFSDIGIGSVVIANIPDKKRCFGNPARIF